MNGERLIALAERIEAEPLAYAQNTYGAEDVPEPRCGAPACLAGLAASVYGAEVECEADRDERDATRRKTGVIMAYDAETHTTGLYALGLTVAEAEILFRPAWPLQWFEEAGCGKHTVGPTHYRRRDGRTGERYEAIQPGREAAPRICRWLATFTRLPKTSWKPGESPAWEETTEGGREPGKQTHAGIADRLARMTLLPKTS